MTDTCNKRKLPKMFLDKVEKSKPAMPAVNASPITPDKKIHPLALLAKPLPCQRGALNRMCDETQQTSGASEIKAYILEVGNEQNSIRMGCHGSVWGDT